MNDELLGMYLNDHLAGADLAIETLEHCRDNHADASLKAKLEELRNEIEDDRAVLKNVIERVESHQPIVKPAVAWIAEKASRLKLGGGSNDPHEIAFHRLQQLELLYTGVNGKYALWTSLEVVSAHDSRLTDLNFENLKQRAQSQLRRIEDYRVDAAREAFLLQDAD